MDKYDVIVVGAGNGGLISALRLQKEGKKVLLLEKHNIPGGFATSFKRGRFEFEASLHELCDYGNELHKGGVYELFEELGISNIEMVDVPEAFHVYGKSTKEDYSMPFGIPAFISKMEEYVPGSKESMQEFFDLAKEIKDAFGYLNECAGKPDTKVLKEKYGNFMRVATSNVADVLKTLKMPVKAQEILSTYWAYLGSPISKLSFVHYAIMVYQYIDLKAQIPVGRSHDLSLTIADEFSKLGGEIRYSSEVVKIIIENKKVCGVELNSGERMYSNHIIFNGHPNSLYDHMLEEQDIPKEELKLVNVRNLGARGVCIYLGLNKSPKELGLTDYSYFIYETLSSDEEYKRMQQMEQGNNVSICLNNAIPDCSPKGTTILMLTGLYFSDCFGSVVTKDNYYKIKEEIADRIITSFEEATNLKIKPYIEEIEIATPLTYAHYTNAPEGTIYGYMADGYDNLMGRLARMYDEQSIKGLRFCGGASVRLDGYSSSYLSGDLAAKLTLMDMKGEEK